MKYISSSFSDNSDTIANVAMCTHIKKSECYNEILFYFNYFDDWGNQEKTYWSYPNKEARDTEFQRIMEELIDG